jgi:hypothetical protein
MKKALVVAMLLSGLFLHGCGKGGGSNASSNPSSNPGGGNFTLNLVDAAAGVKAAARFTDPGTPPIATDVRVVIRTFGTVTTDIEVCADEFGTPPCDIVQVATFTETYKDIQDVPYAPSVSIGIPAGTGYRLDVVTSHLESGNHSILKYGYATGVDVGSSMTATITISSVSTILNMAVADSVLAKGKFDVTLNNVLPFRNIYQMMMSFPTFTPTVITSTTNTSTFTAPASFQSGAVSLEGHFSLDQTLMNAGESNAQWQRIFPNGAYSEVVSSQLSPLITVIVPAN